jgi:hypothetical protein
MEVHVAQESKGPFVEVVADRDLELRSGSRTRPSALFSAIRPKSFVLLPVVTCSIWSLDSFATELTIPLHR